MDKPYALDADRGFTKRLHPAGFYIAEYADQPGEYFNVYGEPVPPSIAKEAGFDVEESQRVALRLRLMSDARRKVEEQLESLVQQEIDKHETALQSEHAHLKPASVSAFSATHHDELGGDVVQEDADDAEDRPKRRRGL